MESVMKLIIMVAIGLLAAPAIAQAEPGTYDPEFYRNIERNYRVMRDGSIQQLIAEGRANKQAFEDLKAREAAGANPPGTQYVRQPRRR
jgi:hypothetical protein